VGGELAAEGMGRAVAEGAVFESVVGDAVDGDAVEEIEALGCRVDVTVEEWSAVGPPEGSGGSPPADRPPSRGEEPRPSSEESARGLRSGPRRR
jgi:hypothetical protein